MKLEKHTWCHNCETGELVRMSVDKEAVFFVDVCSVCGATKHTVIRGVAAGSVWYKCPGADKCPS
jgi:transcription elongation factor Elf1